MPPPEVPGEGPDASGPDGPAVPDAARAGNPTGSHDNLPPAESSLEDLGVVIPDDPSALEPERQTLLDEQARGIGAAHGPDFSRREPPPGLPRFMSGRWSRFGISGPLIIAILLTVAVIGSFLTILTPNTVPGPTPAPLAQTPSGLVAGEVGALLPDAQVQLDGIPLNVQRFRPVVLAIVPRDCPQCEATLRNAQRQTREFGLRLALVGAADQAEQMGALSRTATNRLAAVLVDPQSGLTGLYPPNSVTLVLVHSDGIIGSLVRDPTATQPLELQLAQLAQPAQRAKA